MSDCEMSLTLEEVKFLRKLTSVPYIQLLWDKREAELGRELTAFFDNEFINNKERSNERETDTKSN